MTKLISNTQWPSYAASLTHTPVHLDTDTTPKPWRQPQHGGGKWLDEVVVVDDSGVREAMDHLVNRCKVVAEPSGAAALAAVRMGRMKLHGPACVIISGGNVSHKELAEMLSAAGGQRHAEVTLRRNEHA